MTSRKIMLWMLAVLATIALAACGSGDGSASDDGTGCDEGKKDCGGTCVDTNSDTQNCGTCDNVCYSGQSCIDGSCQCPGGTTICDFECVDTQSDKYNCGGCGSTCSGTASCVNGSCDCSNNERLCGNECVDTTTNATHCGSCNNACPTGASCVNSNCSCGTDMINCAGECVNTNSSTDHCGQCGNACAEDQRCDNGNCRAPLDEICDNKDNDLDGNTDEELTRSCDNLCGPGTETCDAGEWVGCTAPAPEAETCNEKDDNCDGLTDEGVQTTYYRDNDQDTYGDPNLTVAVMACEKPAGNYVTNNEDCDDTRNNVHPGHAEDCDGIDNNCNNTADENCACAPIGTSEACGTNEGACVEGERECTANGWSECGGDDYVPAQPNEICNQLDDDCDGTTDEDLSDDLFESNGVTTVNDTCESAVTLADVVENAPAVTAEDLTLYHGSLANDDSDWIYVTAKEADHTIECAIEVWTRPVQCNYVFFTTLYVPNPDRHNDIVFCLYPDYYLERDCSGLDTPICTDSREDADYYYDEETQSYSIGIRWHGLCALNDDYGFFVEVKYADDAIKSCEPYDLEFQSFWPGDFAATEEECPEL